MRNASGRRAPLGAVVGFVVSATLVAALGGCGARFGLDEAAGGEGGSSEGTGGEGGAPRPVPPSQIYVTDAETFEGAARIDGFDSMTSKSWVNFDDDKQLFDTCNPVLDAQGRLLFVDNSPSHTRIIRIDDLTGAGFVAFGSTGTLLPGQFGELSGLALDARGRIYVTDPESHRVVRIDDMSGAGWTTFGAPGGGTGVGEFKAPDGVAISSTGEILVGDWDSGRIIEMDDMTGAGWKSFHLPDGRFGRPAVMSVAYDAQDRIYATDFENSTLFRLDDIAGDGRTAFIAPVQLSHVFVHASGRIYLVFLNAAQSVGQMDDMEGHGFVMYGGPGEGTRHFKNPCGIVAR